MSAPTAIRQSSRASRQARHLAQSVILEETGPSTLVRMAMLLICAMVLGFLAWSSLTEVKEVAVAQGEVVPSSDIQVIQHKEGGIVRDILVAKGQMVEARAVLARLDAVEAQSEMDKILTRRMSLMLKAERLSAFASGREPNFSFAMVDENHDALVRDQTRILELQREEAAAARQVMENQLERNLKENDLVTGQIKALEKQILISQEQRGMRKELMDMGLGSRLSFLEAEREIERLRAEIARLEQQSEVGREERAEIESRLTQMEATNRRDALKERGEVTAELAEVEQSLAAERDRVRRLEVRAPMRGIVQDLAVRTKGAVLQPGDELLTLVPVDDNLLIEARIQTRDVGHVKAGQEVTVKVSSYDFARYGAVEGRLTDVSPTTFVDETTGQPYYKGFVSLERNYVGDSPEENPILPGMTVEADIVTGEKTVLAYLLKPIYISLSQAFRER